jgi:hypothetical protein
MTPWRPEILTEASNQPVAVRLPATDEEIRLIVDGVDVTTYAEFDAGKLRYESGAGPVVLSQGEHTAEVQRVVLPADQTEFSVLDSFTWDFRMA